MEPQYISLLRIALGWRRRPRRLLPTKVRHGSFCMNLEGAQSPEVGNDDGYRRSSIYGWRIPKVFDLCHNKWAPVWAHGAMD